jgi:hypothetical protein
VAGLPVPGRGVIGGDFIQGLRDGDRHHGGIRCLRLFRLEPSYFEALRGEALSLVDQETASVVGDPAHVTHWTRPRGMVRQFSLLNRSGRFEDYASDHDLSCLGKRFHAAGRYPSLARLAAAFPHAVNVRINAMAPGARLSPHEEHLLFRTRAGAVAMRLRCHLPIAAEAGAELTLDGEVHHLEPGVIHLVNQGCVHAASNGGAAERIHLVWDTLLTRAAFEILAGTTHPPLPASRIAPEDRLPRPLRSERVGPFVALPPRVRPEEAEAVDWCEVQ